MRTTRPALSVLAVVAAMALLTWPARAQQATGAAPPPPMPMPTPAPPAADAAPADRAMMSGMTQMSHAMADVPMTGDPDRDFVAMMLPHHQGAIDMARVELQYGRDPAMLRLAKAILAAQGREVATMQAWQAKHPVP